MDKIFEIIEEGLHCSKVVGYIVAEDEDDAYNKFGCELGHLVNQISNEEFNRRKNKAWNDYHNMFNFKKLE